MSVPILTLPIKYEQDVVGARQRARQVADLLGFDQQDQTRIATAVSEIARNAFIYAKSGEVEFQLEGQLAPQVLLIHISDRGPGIATLAHILAEQYQSPTGMGLGIIGARRLMDQCDIQSTPGQGTSVWLKKVLPKRAPLVTAARLQQIVGELTSRAMQEPLAEIRQQNQELLQALAEVRERREELAQLNQELEDTNRGVVALYAELDEKADHLRRADEMKSRFLSNMSHEFRTPLSSILALSQLLMDRSDGDLTGEQEKQVRYIRKSAEGLLEMVNDLLDLAKIEAGKIEVRPIEFSPATLFSALRGMLRPLLISEAVNLVFEDPKDIPPLYSDEGKVSQILRNFISNALKFTERGEVRVKATLSPTGDAVIFAVSDTGVGITPEDQERIFEEFTQIEHPLQGRVKGTGLGLPLCRRLATLLGGRVDVASQLDVGSVFTATIPLEHRDPTEEFTATMAEWMLDPQRQPVLLVEDEPEIILLYEKYLRGSNFQLLSARNLREVRTLMAQVRPSAIVLDIMLRGEESWRLLTELKANETTRQIPILVATTVEDQRKGLALGADAYCIKPLTREAILAHLSQFTGLQAEPPATTTQLLVIDDEEATRYLITKLLSDAPGVVHEAENGEEGLRQAYALQPSVIFLDLNMPRMSGYEVLKKLKADPHTQAIPVVIVTSQLLDEAEQRLLAAQAHAIINKNNLSREVLKEVLILE
ncbi:MAG: ATP-binding protein [Chloroflexi bacterium]|nr:ATP-binding protein [Chloroflexota bacterium]